MTKIFITPLGDLLHSTKPTLRALTMFGVFLTLVLFVEGDSYSERVRINRQADIPPSILNRLKSASSFTELSNLAQIRPAAPEAQQDVRSNHVGTNEIEGISNFGVKPIFEDRTLGLLRNSDHNLLISTHSKYANRSNVEKMNDPRQSSDSCKLFTHCVPLPLEREVGAFYFPQCIDLPVCMGGCCDTTHNCHPIRKTPVRVKVRSFKYMGGMNLQHLKDFFVDMEKHESCSCSNCKLETDCGPNQHLRNCQCVCKNRADRESCTGSNKRWSESECKCKCTSLPCGSGEYFDLNHCGCKLIAQIYNSFEPPANSGAANSNSLLFK